MTTPTNNTVDEILTALENAVASDIARRVSQHVSGESPKRSHQRAKQSLRQAVQRLEIDSDMSADDFGRYWISSESKNQAKQSLRQAVQEAMERVIGEDEKPDWDDDLEFCGSCNFRPTDGTKMCLCKYRNAARRKQRQRLTEEMNKLFGSDA